jgi:hypothetical protein
VAGAAEIARTAVAAVVIEHEEVVRIEGAAIVRQPQPQPDRLVVHDGEGRPASGGAAACRRHDLDHRLRGLDPGTGAPARQQSDPHASVGRTQIDGRLESAGGGVRDVWVRLTDVGARDANPHPGVGAVVHHQAHIVKRTGRVEHPTADANQRPGNRQVRRRLVDLGPHGGSRHVVHAAILTALRPLKVAFPVGLVS